MQVQLGGFFETVSKPYARPQRSRVFIMSAMPNRFEKKRSCLVPTTSDHTNW